MGNLRAHASTRALRAPAAGDLRLPRTFLMLVARVPRAGPQFPMGAQAETRVRANEMSETRLTGDKIRAPADVCFINKRSRDESNVGILSKLFHFWRATGGCTRPPERASTTLRRRRRLGDHHVRPPQAAGGSRSTHRAKSAAVAGRHRLTTPRKAPSPHTTQSIDGTLHSSRHSPQSTSQNHPSQAYSITQLELRTRAPGTRGSVATTTRADTCARSTPTLGGRDDATATGRAAW